MATTDQLNLFDSDHKEPDLIRIEAPYFVAGVLLRDGRVYEAAPIVKYMKGWTAEQVLQYAKKKGWTI